MTQRLTSTTRARLERASAPAPVAPRAAERLPQPVGRRAIRANRGVGRDVVWAALCVLVAALGLVTLYHLNQPKPYVPYHDTWEYVRRADTILRGGPWVDPIRMPGYPMLLAVVFAFAGKSNLVAADAAQQALFVIGALEVFALAQRALRSLPLATLVGLLFATNVYIYSFFKPILSDGLAMTLVVGMALAALAFIERPSVARFWLVALFALAALLTRAEWVLLPIALFPAMLLVASRAELSRETRQGMAKGMTQGMAQRMGRQVWRRFAPHVALGWALIYGVTLTYVVSNARINGYFGLSDASNINLYGKVTQYGMQEPATGKLAHVGQVTERFVSRGMRDPWSIYWRAHEISGPHFSWMGAYARGIILRHPFEFLARSVPLAFESLGSMYVFGKYLLTAPFGGTLHQLQVISLIAQPLYGVFPVCAAGWLAVLVWRWRQRRDGAQSVSRIASLAGNLAGPMCLLALIAVYGVAITTLTSYAEYARLHLDFDPLMMIVTVGGLAMALRVAAAHTPALAQRARGWMGGWMAGSVRARATEAGHWRLPPLGV